MPVLRTRPPENKAGHYGEFELFQKLERMTIPRTELWFNLKLPLVREIDLIINEPSLGTYIAEVKSFFIDEISDYSLEEMELSSGERRKNPIEQVTIAEFGLRDLLNRKNSDRRIRTPFLQKTAIWNRITRAEFVFKFTREMIFEQSQGMIFSDDLTDEDAFFEALERVTEYHFGGHVPVSVRTEQAGTQILREITANLSLDAQANLDLQMSSRERDELNTFAKQSNTRLEKFRTGKGLKVAFRGFPGSGKTLALREIGLQRYLSGESVLFLCFNKTLATKFRLEVTELIARSPKTDGVFLVYDYWEFYKSLYPNAELSNLATEVIPALEDMKEANELATFDTILIDESQDADGELFKVIELITKPDTSIFIAYGDNQQLYNCDRYNGKHSPELEEFLNCAIIEQFKRNFRSGPVSQLVCAAISDFYPSVHQALEWLQAQINSRNNRNFQGMLEFNEFVYEPKIIMTDTPPNFTHQRFLLESVTQLVDSTRESTQSQELDAMIIVASERSKSYEKIVEFLKLYEIPFIDHVDKSKRRVAPKPSEIVITTYQSARGLTCKNAIVTDIDILESNEGRANYPPVSNLLNVALSRASGTTLVVTGVHISEYPNRPVLQYLSALLEMLETDLAK